MTLYFKIVSILGVEEEVGEPYFCYFVESQSSSQLEI